VDALSIYLLIDFRWFTGCHRVQKMGAAVGAILTASATQNIGRPARCATVRRLVAALSAGAAVLDGHQTTRRDHGGR
jgi:hypothetical protein